MQPIIWAGVMSLICPGVLLADVAYLANGKTLEGHTWVEGDGRITVELLRGGRVTLNPRDVRRIVKQQTPIDEFDKRYGELANDSRTTVSDWLGLALYAENNGLQQSAQRTYERVLLVDPNNAEARISLGYKQYNGQWLTQREYADAAGLIQYRGTWVTPEQLTEIRSLEAKTQSEKSLADLRQAEAQQQQAQTEALQQGRCTPGAFGQLYDRFGRYGAYCN